MPEVTLLEALAKLGVGGILAGVLLFLHVRQLRVFSRAIAALTLSHRRDRKECHREVMLLGKQLRSVQQQVLKLAEVVYKSSKEGKDAQDG